MERTQQKYPVLAVHASLMHNRSYKNSQGQKSVSLFYVIEPIEITENILPML